VLTKTPLLMAVTMDAYCRLLFPDFGWLKATSWQLTCSAVRLPSFTLRKFPVSASLATMKMLSEEGQIINTQYDHSIKILIGNRRGQHANDAFCSRGHIRLAPAAQ
jgi:hypothetical protein